MFLFVVLFYTGTQVQEPWNGQYRGTVQYSNVYQSNRVQSCDGLWLFITRINMILIRRGSYLDYEEYDVMIFNTLSKKIKKQENWLLF